ncbi:MAG: cell division protein FtsA [Bacteroidia bacterium]
MPQEVHNPSQGTPVIVGLDIGTTKVCAIVGTYNQNKKLEILGVGKAESFGVIRGEVKNLEKTTTAIKEAIEKAKQHLLKNNIKIEINSVHVGIAGQHIKSLKHSNSISREKPEVVISIEDVNKLKEDARKLMLPPGDEIIHALPQEYAVDDISNIPDPIGMTGVRLSSNFHIITGNVLAISNINRSVRDAELNVADLILEPLSSAEAVLDNEEIEGGVCLVDIGGGTTDVAIFKKGVIRHTAVIPLGGNIITKDIEDGCNVLPSQAELLKIKFGSALANENKENEVVSIPGFAGRPPREISVKNIAHIIQARVEEIFKSVLYEIKISGLEKNLAAGIVITGGGSQLKHLDKLVEFVTGLDTRIGLANMHIGKSNFEDIHSPMYATGVGLVIKGLKDEFEKTNSKKMLVVEPKEDAAKENNLIKRIIRSGKKWLYDDDINDF